MADGALSRWERIVIGAALGMGLVALALCLGGFSFHSIRQAARAQHAMGTLSEAKSARRLRNTDALFRPLRAGDEIAGFDTLATAADGALTLDFGDGGKVELGPSTMARISDLPGIGARVELVAGRLVAKTSRSAVALDAGGKRIVVAPNQTRVFEYSTAKPPGPDNPVKVSEPLP